MKSKFPGRSFLGVLFVAPIFLLSACGSATNTHPGNHSTPTAQVRASSRLQSIERPNVKIAVDPSAAEVPKLFYQYLGQENYKAAVALLGPQLRFEGDKNFIEYLKNIKKATFVQFEDVSKGGGHIDPTDSKYYETKVYYGVIDFEVRDPSLVPGLQGINYRQFILIKQTPTSPWLIDVDEDTPERG